MMILDKRLAFIGALAGVVALSVTGCGDSATALLSPTAASVSGNWERSGEVPGSSERWVLAASGDSISAVGSWTGEACCAGTITGSGSISGDSIHVDLKFFDSGNSTGTPRFTEHVDGVQPTANDIVGTATRDSTTAPIHMQRTLIFTVSDAPPR